MRDIKFRAWQIHKKEMFLNVHSNYREALNDIFEDDKFIFMQYTGLKDNNGKEIYEGDVLEVDSKIFDDLKSRICKMIWNENSYGWRLSIESDKMIKSKNLKVIGNIHENPELL